MSGSAWTARQATGRWKGAMLILASAACISVTFIASKQAMRDLSPLAFTPVWFAAASAWGIGFYLWHRGLRWPAGLNTALKPVLWLGVLNGAANFLLFTAINLGDPTLAAFFSRSETVYSVFLGALLLGEQLRRYQWAGAGIAITGAGVITFRAGPVVWLMLGILLVSNFLLALSGLIAKQQVGNVPPLVLSTARTLLMSVLLGLAGLAAGALAWPSLAAWGWIIGGSFFGPFLSYVLFYKGLQHLDLARSAVIRATQPVFVAVYSLILFGVLITIQQFVGGLLMVAGVALMLWEGRPLPVMESIVNHKSPPPRFGDFVSNRYGRSSLTLQSIPTLRDIVAARPHVYRYLSRTPLYHYVGLSKLVGAEVWVKHENHQPVGAFKVRGGLNLAAHLTPEERRAGLFTASTGNHGQSIAFAAYVHGIKATIAVPEGANPGKVTAMRNLNAEVVVYGKDFDAAREWIMAEAEARGGRFVGPTEERLIEGVGTYALEIIEDLPDVQTIIVPVGAGSGACGVSIVAKTVNPDIEVIAAQSAQAPAMQLSWRAGRLVTAEMNTFAEGVATRVPFENTQRIMRQYLDDFVLVDDADIKAAIRLLLEHTHNLAEGAGAVSLAAAIQLRERLAGKKTVLVLSGGNLSLERLREVLGEDGM